MTDSLRQAAVHPGGRPASEAECVARRRARWFSGDKAMAEAPVVGVALSGGGIRSATQCLGLFQSLAKRQQIRRVDYLSTVSGGGYFGVFLTSLFLPAKWRRCGEATQDDFAQAAQNAEHALAGTPNSQSGLYSESEPVRYLRKYGQYLLAHGFEDRVYAVATAVRNWFALHYVIAVSIVFLLLLLGSVHLIGPWLAPKAWGVMERWLVPDGEGVLGWVWWSWLWVAALGWFALVCMPMAWAYWMTLSRSRHRMVNEVTLLNGALVITAWLYFCGCIPFAMQSASFALVAFAVAVLGSIAIPCYWAAALFTRANNGKGPPPQLHAVRSQERAQLSLWLARALWGVGILCVLALVDTIGQTIYINVVGENRAWGGVALGAGGAGVLVLMIKAALNWLTVQTEKHKGLRRIAVNSVTTIGGALLFIALASLWSAVSVGFLWQGDDPFEWEEAASGEPASARVFDSDVVLNSLRDTVSRDLSLPCVCAISVPMGHPVGQLPEWRGWLTGVVISLALAAFAAAYVHFVNLSSLQSFYASRLRRTFLRGSRFADPDEYQRIPRNGESALLQRDRPAQTLRPDVADLHDDLEPHRYYATQSFAPIHLINVTINQTLSREAASIVSRDRKGLALAMGPCGFSVGTQQWLARDGAGAFPGEPLAIGTWCAISGAAFTTGHGQGTSLGLSLLMTLANVRLGYWWSSPGYAAFQAESRRDMVRHRMEDVNARVRTLTQKLIYRELLGRYRGVEERRWYLSDGGHFDNTGVYQLIRRDMPFVVLADFGADPDYQFNDLANLVRKARIDFSAEIEMIQSEWLATHLPPSLRPYFGTQEDFQRKRNDGSRPEGKVGEHPYALLAQIRYVSGATGMLLVLKPRMSGHEPTDLLSYYQENPTFPEQTTLDQFFDEAQWESYRKLGETMGKVLFDDYSSEMNGAYWWPAQFKVPEW